MQERKGESMPVISIKMSSRPREIKRELVKKLSVAAAETTGLPVEAFTVLIEELPAENIGIGGKLLDEK